MRRSHSFRQRGVPARFARRKRPKRAFLHAALRTAHSLRDIFEPRIPSTKPAERMRFRRPLVAACNALEDQGVLAKFIAQFVDMKSDCHAADCHDTGAARPSSVRTGKTLYDAGANSGANSDANAGSSRLSATPRLPPRRSLDPRVAPERPRRWRRAAVNSSARGTAAVARPTGRGCASRARY